MDDNSPKYGHFIGHLTHHVGIPNLGRRPRALNNYDRPLQKTRLTFFAPRNTQIWKNVRKHIPEKNNRISILVQVIFAPISAWKDDIQKWRYLQQISSTFESVRIGAHWLHFGSLLGLLNIWKFEQPGHWKVTGYGSRSAWIFPFTLGLFVRTWPNVKWQAVIAQFFEPYPNLKFANW